MKKYFLIFLFLTPFVLHAQMDVIGSLGLGGGLNFGYLNPNLKDLNSQIKTAGFLEFEKGFPAYGGGLVATLGMYRFGYYSLSGKKQTSLLYKSLIPLIDNTEKLATLEYGYKMGLIGIEFFYIEDFHFAFDLGLGVGTMDLELISKQKDANISWGGVMNDFNTINAQYTSRKLSTQFFQYQPSLVIEYIAWNFAKFFVAGDFIGTIGGNWYLDNDTKVSDVPKMNFNGFSIRAGVYVGIFL